MDFQHGITQRLPDPEPLLERVRTAIADARASGVTIGYVRVAFTEEDWAAIPDTAMFAFVGQHRLMHHQDPSTAIHDALAPEAGDIDGTDDPDTEARDFLLGKVFPRRAEVIDTGTLRALLGP
jgi:nicotinamidase-related amidase